MFPSRITRYVLRELLTPTLLGLLLYTGVMLVNYLFLVVDKSLRLQLGLEQTLRLFAVGIPPILVLTIPMATLLGTLIAAGRLSADHEWAALQSAGGGPGVLLRPVAIHGLLAALAGFALFAVVVPESTWARRKLDRDILASTSPVRELRPRVFYSLPRGVSLFVNEIGTGTEGRLEGVILIRPDLDVEGATQILMAPQGQLYAVPDRPGSLALDLFDAESYSYGPGDKDVFLQSARVAENLPIPREPFLDNLSSMQNRTMVQDLTLPAVLTELRKAEAARQAPTTESPTAANRGQTLLLDRRVWEARAELHQRFALPCAAFVLALVGLPLGIVRARSGKGAGFAVALLVIVLYRVVFVLTRNRVVDGKLPVIGVWIADLLVLAWAIWALLRLRGSIRASGSLSRSLRAVGSKLTHWRTERALRGSETPAQSDLLALGGTGNRFVGRLDRYIGLAFLRVLALALASTVLIQCLVELQSVMDSAFRAGKPLSHVLSYMGYFLPTALGVALPISCLVAAVVTFALLSRTGELVAIRAAGISLRRATVPVLILTSGLCLLLFLVQDRIAPVAERKAQAVHDQIKNRAPRTYGASGRWSFGADGETLYHYQLYEPEQKQYRTFHMLKLDRARPSILSHRFGETARLTPRGWSLDGGWKRTLVRPEPSAPAAKTDLPFEVFEGTHVVPVGSPTDLAQQKKDLDDGGDLADETSVAELRDHIDTLEKSGYDVTQLRVAYYGKFSQSMAPLVMVLLGLPFGFRVGRRGSLYGVGVALVLAIVYWATFAVFNGLGLQALFPAPVAAWAPNVLFGLFGLYLLLYVKT